MVDTNKQLERIRIPKFPSNKKEYQTCLAAFFSRVDETNLLAHFKMLRLESCLDSGEAAENRGTQRRFPPKCIETLFRLPRVLLSAIKSAVQSLEIDGEDITSSKQISASSAAFFCSGYCSSVCLGQLWGWEYYLS